MKRIILLGALLWAAVGLKAQDVTAPIGSTVVMSATVGSGTPPFTYQWFKDGVLVSNANTYTITGVQPQNAGKYTVKVTNSAGTAVSPESAMAVGLIIPGSITITITVK